jgi:hypothetical protein
VPDEPSPKDQLQVIGATPPDMVPAKLISLPTSVRFELALAVTLSFGWIATDKLLVEVILRLSVAVILAEKVPAVA